MNENIGAKGGRRDRRRTLIIAKEKEKKLKQAQTKEQEQLKKLEKKVKQIQIVTFFKAVPIIIAGQTFKTLIGNINKKEEKKAKKENPNNKEIEVLVVQQKNSKLQKIEKEKNIIIHRNIIINSRKQKPKEEIEILQELTEIKNKNTDNRKVEIKQIKQDSIDIKTVPISKKSAGIQVVPIEDVKKEEQKQIQKPTPAVKKVGIENQKIEKELNNITNKEILDKYEKKLKEVRSDLKKLDFEYMILEEKSDKLYREKDAEELLKNLDVLIEKIKELKEKIKTKDFPLYDENYLEELIKEYIDEFNNKKVVKEIKDSPLYIMISEKLEELDKSKNKLKSKVEKRKNKLAIDDKKLQKLKEKYYDFTYIDKLLNNIAKDQEHELDILKEKVKNSKTEIEKVTYEIDEMAKQSNKLLRRIAILSLIPGIRSAMAMATMVAYYMYLMKNVENPGIKRRVTKEINVKDYHIDIESSISKIDDASKMVSSTTSKLKKEISKFKKDFKEYFSIMPECRTLLSNLNNVLDDLEDKQKEIKDIKEKQSKLLKENQAKVLEYKND